MVVILCERTKKVWGNTGSSWFLLEAGRAVECAERKKGLCLNLKVKREDPREERRMQASMVNRIIFTPDDQA